MLRAERISQHALFVAAFCLASIICSASIAQPLGSRSSSFFGRMTPSCSPQCVVSRGLIQCPHFLDTPEHLVCADYAAQWTPCGWQLRRVFMCR